MVRTVCVHVDPQWLSGWYVRRFKSEGRRSLVGGGYTWQRDARVGREPPRNRINVAVPIKYAVLPEMRSYGSDDQKEGYRTKLRAERYEGCPCRVSDDRPDNDEYLRKVGMRAGQKK